MQHRRRGLPRIYSPFGTGNNCDDDDTFRPILSFFKHIIQCAIFVVVVVFLCVIWYALMLTPTDFN